jgi:hypothetical protein
MANLEQFHSWLAELSRFSAIDTHIERRVSDPGEFRFCIYTDNNCYAITAREPTAIKVKAPGAVAGSEKLSIAEIEKLMDRQDRIIEIAPDGQVSVWPAVMGLDDGYLGCTSQCRKPRAGEQHHRGSDLRDGPLAAETWHGILADIVSYEMVMLAKTARPVADG